jgi:hypothetical protein
MAVKSGKPGLKVSCFRRNLPPVGRHEENHYLMLTPARDRDADELCEEQVRLRERFDQLVIEWKKATRFSSSTREMAMHPAYQRIIGMGPAAVPFLLRELEVDPDHWFWALAAITGEDPVPPEDRGRLKRMAASWLNWGRQQGYKW